MTGLRTDWKMEDDKKRGCGKKTTYERGGGGRQWGKQRRIEGGRRGERSKRRV